MTGSTYIASDALRILFAGGGTGGHVYPALSIARALQALVPSAVVEFAGTTSHLEWTAVPKAGFVIHPITVSPLHRKLTFRNLGFPFKLLKGLWQSMRLVRRFKPHAVVGTGGYVAGPVLWAAARSHVPTVLQEQNAFAGKTNKLLAKNADQIHIAFDEARKWFPGKECLLSGNPVRPDLLSTNRTAARAYFKIEADQKVILLFGGSLGSAAMNRVLAKKYKEILDNDDTVLIWQTGGRYYERYLEMIEEHARLRLLQYIDRMDYAYAAADVVVCRAGASTCSELENTGSPAILIPSPNVAEDHQTYNALSLANDGAAIVLPESKMEFGLVSAVRELLADSVKRDEMRRKLKARARPDAAKNIAVAILELVGLDVSEFVNAKVPTQ